MVSLHTVEQQLQDVGCNYKMWGRSEIRELRNVLMPDEIIAQAVNGTYEGGFALLCVTNYRVLLVDRKPMLLTLEDIRYDMMSEVDYHNKLIGAIICIMTPMRTLTFTSWSVVRLRKCLNYIQQRVMEIRQNGLMPFMQMQTHAGSPLSGVVGQGGGPVQAVQAGVQQLPFNPYTKSPLQIRRRRFPTFY